jgi:hypothetical protein
MTRCSRKRAQRRGLIATNPARRLRLAVAGRNGPHAQPSQVTDLAHRASPSDSLLIVTAAYTGMRVVGRDGPAQRGYE